MSRDQQFISEMRAAVRAIWNGINTLKSGQREWNAKDYLNNLEAGDGEHAGLAPADIGACVFDTTNQIEAAITGANAGHSTNLAKLL
jgi:hypothetical protein